MNEQAKDYQMQAKVMWKEGNFQKAEELYLKALTYEEDEELYMELSRVYANEERCEDAMAVLEKALEINPKNGHIYYNMGFVYLIQKLNVKAIEQFRQAERFGCDLSELYKVMASVYDELGDCQMELQYYSKAIKADPFDGKCYVKKALILVNEERHEEALETLDEMKTYLPDAFECYDMIARICAMIGKYDAAFQILDEGISKFPDDEALYCSKIQLLLEQNQLSLAEEMVDDYHKKFRNSTSDKARSLVDVSLAAAYDDKETMYDFLKKIVDGESEEECDEEVCGMLMITSVLLERYDTAMEMAQKLVSQESDSSEVIEAIFYIGAIAAMQGKEELSQQYYRDATKRLRKISLSGEHLYECYMYRALSHMELGEYEQALELAECVVQMNGECPDGYEVLANIYERMGDGDKSLVYYDIASEKCKVFYEGDVGNEAGY